MLSINNLKHDTSWLNAIDYSLAMCKRGRQVTAIVQAFLEVSYGENIYTFVQQSRTSELDTYDPAVGRLIAGIRLQAAIALWRAKGFHKLATFAHNGAAVMVIPKHHYPDFIRDSASFIRKNLKDAIHKQIRYQQFTFFASYPFKQIQEGAHPENTIPGLGGSMLWSQLNIDFESRYPNWVEHISKQKMVDTILWNGEFNFHQELERNAQKLRDVGIDPTLITDDECEEVVRRERAISGLTVVARRLGVPEEIPPHLIEAQLKHLDFKIEESRPTQEQYEKHKAPEVEIPDRSHIELPKEAHPERNLTIDMPDTRRLALRRQGDNDLEIEAFRNGQWIPTYISDLREGEFFHVTQESPYGKLPEGRCFHARGRVRVIPTSDPKLPTFMVQGLEIATAPQTPENNRLLRLPEHSVTGIGNYNVRQDATLRNNVPAALLFNKPKN